MLSVAALCLSIAGLIVALLPKQAAGDVQYVMYLGTNDKDTNEPVFAPDEAKTKAEEILLRHVGGWTSRRRTAAGRTEICSIANIRSSSI